MAEKWRLADGTALVFEEPVPVEDAIEQAAFIGVEVEWAIGDDGERIEVD